MSDSRRTMSFVTATLRERDGVRELVAPQPGYFRDAVPVGSVVAPGAALGVLEVLGRQLVVRAPEGAYGQVGPTTDPNVGVGQRARRPVGHGDVLLLLSDALATMAGQGAEGSAGAVGGGGALRFRAPTSGRFYARPAPDKAPFVAVGDIVTNGTCVGLLEVMKTFNRIHYGGDGLPPQARVTRIVAADQSDLDTGDVVLELEPV